MTMRGKIATFLMAFTLSLVSAEAAIKQQDVITVTNLPLGPSLAVSAVTYEGKKLSFRLAAFAVNENGEHISCSAMPSFKGTEFFVPKKALELSTDELRQAYSACLEEANKPIHAIPSTTGVIPKAPKPHQVNRMTAEDRQRIAEMVKADAELKAWLENQERKHQDEQKSLKAENNRLQSRLQAKSGKANGNQNNEKVGELLRQIAELRSQRAADKAAFDAEKNQLVQSVARLDRELKSVKILAASGKENDQALLVSQLQLAVEAGNQHGVKI